MRRMRWMLLLGALLSSCAITEKVYEKDGEEYGVVPGAFRGRWYNYYQRGQSYLKGGYAKDAAADFRKALELRSVDQRRARTYGLHFIDYFPNRELGIALLGLGQMDAAIGSLTASLRQVDSGRAEYFLNQARRAQLLAQGVSDTEGPSITIATPTAGVVNKGQIELVARIADDHLVETVVINGKPELLTVAVAAVEVRRVVHLAPGANEVRVRALDLFGNRSEQVVQLVLDQDAPSVNIAEITEEAGQWYAAMTVEDDSGVASILVNGSTPGERVAIVAGDNEIKVEDKAGNVATMAFNGADLRADLAADDTSPPAIRLKSIPTTVYVDRVFIEGMATDRVAVARLSVAGKQVSGEGKPAAYFRRVVPLKIGTNPIEVVAVDDAGRTTTETLTVERREPAAAAVNSRLSITMAPFLNLGQGESADAVEQNLENGIVDRKRFYLMDRSRVAALVTEWQLVASDLTDDGPDMLRLGQEMGADTTMLGWAQQRGDAIEVYGRLVDSQTGTILLEKDVFHEKLSLRNLRDLLYGLALKFEAALPGVAGTLGAAGGAGTAFNLEGGTTVPVGARLLVVGPTQQTPYGAEQEILGELRVGPERNDVAQWVQGSAPAGAVLVVK